MTVVVLSGGSGGAKLARGLLEVAGDELVVVANTGDDIEIYGAYVCPDPDLVLFRLADRLDERGWGLAGDTFHAMERYRARGEDVWFNLGDEDLEIGRDRARRLAAGERLTEAIDALRRTLHVPARVLPMCDEPAPTLVDGTPFQEWMIRGGARLADPLSWHVETGGAGATITPEVADALAAARAVVIGPSNPVISIGPILAVAGMREALARTEAPVVAVSPFVRGQIVKGPTAQFAPTPQAALAHYGGLLDGVVADARVDGLPVLETDVAMPDVAAMARLAEATLRFATALA